MIKFKVFQGAHRQFYAHMVAPNGKIIWQSEGYKRVSDAHRLCNRTVADIRGGVVPYTYDSLLPKARS